MKPILQQAVRLGYTVVGVADRESLSAAVELGGRAEAMGFCPLTGLELRAGLAGGLSVVLLARDPAGYRQLLALFSALPDEGYRKGGLAGLLTRAADITGAGLACLVEPPANSGAMVGPGAQDALLGPLHVLFERMAQATFYLRLPMPGLPGCPPSRVEALSHLAAQTGLTPIAMPLAAFLEPADGPLWELGWQYRLSQLRAEGEEEAAAALPAPSPERFRSFLLRPATEVETAYGEYPSALGHARRLAQHAGWGWHPQQLSEPAIRLERGFNPETYLWDRIQNAVEHRRPEQVRALRERLYEEFSALRRHGRVGLFLTLCELFRLLPQPGLVVLPDRMTRGLLCAHLLGLTPFDPVAQGAAFDEDTIRHLRNPLVLHIPDGLQGAILEILADLFGEACLGVIAESQEPPPASLRAMVSERQLEKHSQAIPYLKWCGQASSGRIRWVLAVSRPVAAEVPCRPGAPPLGRWSQLALTPKQALAVPGIVLDLAPDANQTRLYRLGGGGLAASADTEGQGLSLQQRSTVQEILPLLYPHVERPVVWLVFRAMQPQTLSQLAATLALLELERRDRAGFLRSLRIRRRIVRGAAESLGGVLSAEHGREALESIVQETDGLLLFRDQLPPLFERVFGLPSASVARVVRQVLAGGVRLLPAEQMVKEVVGLSETPEVTYPLTPLLSQLPRYLSSRQHCRNWAKTLLQFAAVAEENPLAFAREVLDESLRPDVEIPAVQMFLEKRGKRLLPPDINRSDASSRIEGDALRLGFSRIENIGPVTSRHLVESRQERLFASLEEVFRRTHRRPVTRRVMRELVLCGAFDDFRGGRPFHQARREALETVATQAQEAGLPLVEDPQSYLFDLGLAALSPEETGESVPLPEPTDLVQEESRILGVPLSMPAGRALARLLPFEPSLEPPARHHWWLGREVLQAGVLRDIWPWLEGEAGVFTLASLYSGSGCFWVVAAPHLRDRFVALAESSRRSGGSPLVLTLGRLGGRPKQLDRLTLGLLPGIESPQLLQQTPHLYLYDFEPLQSVSEGARCWVRLEVRLAPGRSRLVSRLRSAIQPFRVEPRTLPGCRLKLEAGGRERLPRAALRLEEVALLPSHMLLRRLERLDGVAAARFVEGEPGRPLLLF